MQRYGGLAFSVLLLLAGWIIILQINRWYFTAPVFFLFMGWLGVLLSARFLWQAGWSAATEPLSDEDFWEATGAREELEREKRSLLKAIKEIDFDHEMGKMSDEDAAELERFYRARAIEVIKALEGGDGDGGDGGVALDQLIERDLKARRAIASAARRSRDKASESAAGESDS